MENEQKVKINFEDWDNEKFVASYANHIQILHTPEEFVIELFSLFPPKGVLLGRYALSPQHVKRLAKALQHNITTYESQFGTIPESEGTFVAPVMEEKT